MYVRFLVIFMVFVWLYATFIPHHQAKHKLATLNTNVHGKNNNINKNHNNGHTQRQKQIKDKKNKKKGA